MPYTTAGLNAIIAQLESALGKGYAEVEHEGHTLRYKGTEDILKAIGYFKGLLNSATDATPSVDTRTFLFYGGRR